MEIHKPTQADVVLRLIKGFAYPFSDDLAGIRYPSVVTELYDENEAIFLSRTIRINRTQSRHESYLILEDGSINFL